MEQGLAAVTGRVLDMVELEPGNPSLPADLQAKGYGGLKIVAQYNLKTQPGREAYEHVLAGDVADWSFMYESPVNELDSKGRRLLKEIYPVYEVSNVLVGMNQLTRTTANKSRRPQRPKNQGLCPRAAPRPLRQRSNQSQPVRLRYRPPDRAVDQALDVLNWKNFWRLLLTISPFRKWLRSRRLLADWLERDECLPVDAGPQEILRHVGHVHGSDFRAWVGADLKQAIREYRA